MDGGIAGAGGKFAEGFVGKWGQPAADILVGWWRRNNTLLTLGGRGAGRLLAGGIGNIKSIFS